jgi:CelD/BcsL family acetyltransferase involved in cellulose biosynthesis
MQDDAPAADAAMLIAEASEAAVGGGRQRRRKVPMKFWFGPVRLCSVAFTMEVEPWRPALLDGPRPAVPDLAALPAELDGVYRPSQCLDAAEPDWRRSAAALQYVESRFHRRFIDLTTGFDAYLAKFSGKTRSTFRRKIKKFREASSGTIDWRAYRSPGEMQAFYAAARQLSRHTYQEKLFDAGLPEGPEFVSGMLARAEAGRVRGFMLFLDGAPVSYLYLPVADDRVIYGHLGFDPACTALSPGTVLQLLSLEALFAEERLRLFDFTEGEGEHKRLFATHERLCGNVWYLRPTPRNRAIVRLHRETRRLSDFADRQLVQRNLKTRLKHYLRGQRTAPRDEAKGERAEGVERQT